MTETRLVLRDFPEVSKAATFYPGGQAYFRILQIGTSNYFVK